MSELEQIEDRILECNEECGNYYQIQELQEEAENIRNGLESKTKTYGDLLIEIQPQVITNDEQNDANLAHIERLWNIENRTPEEDKLFDLLLLLSEQFEEKAYPMESSWYAGLWCRVQAFIFRW
jgi:hypothetical protein